MRTYSKIICFLVFINIFEHSTFAASPLDILNKYLPDIVVTNIYQETKFLYVTICNQGGTLTESENILSIGIWIPGGWIVSINTPISGWANGCQDYKVAAIEELRIFTSGVYNITTAALIKNGRTEKTISNNKITQSLYISYPSKAVTIPPSSTVYYNSNSTPSSSYCNSSNNYCNNNYNYNNSYRYNSSNIYDTYCNASNNYCNNTNIYNSNNTSCNYTNNYCNNTYNSNYYNNYNNTQYCTSSNNYCNNNSYVAPVNYYRSNICPPGDFICNNDFYNSQNKNSTSCTYLNNYCNYTYNSNYYNNTVVNKPDLTIQRIYQNSGDKHIIAQICNQGGDMINAVSMRTSFSVNNMTANSYNTLQIWQGQCTSTVVFTTSTELGINYTGSYPITVAVDANNAVDESNESNNTFSQSLFLETLQTQLPDLIVDRIFTNDSARTLTARICNVGATMSNNTNWTMEIMSTNNNALMRNTGGSLAQGQCIDITNSYLSLSIYQSGGYNFRVNVDTANVIVEQSESNNALNQYLQLPFGY